MRGGDLVALALACGASAAKAVARGEIALSEEFRSACERNQCGMYGRCWTCPPDAGEIHALMARVQSYECGLLYQTVGTLEDSFDVEGMRRAKREHVGVSQRLARALASLPVTGGLHLSVGGCGLCERCTKPDGAPCRHPELALLSLEACGVDVYNTAKRAGLRYIHGQNTVTYFGLFLYNGEAYA